MWNRRPCSMMHLPFPGYAQLPTRNRQETIRSFDGVDGFGFVHTPQTRRMRQMLRLRSKCFALRLLPLLSRVDARLQSLCLSVSLFVTLSIRKRDVRPGIEESDPFFVRIRAPNKCHYGHTWSKAEIFNV